MPEQKTSSPYAVIGAKQKKPNFFQKLRGQYWWKGDNDFQMALAPQSYPFVVVGGTGSGRRQLTLDLAINNIKNKAPFVFIDGYGDTDLYWRMMSAAQMHGESDNFYIINTLSGHTHPGNSEGKLSHTFDPLNALIGNKYAFLTLFGEHTSSMLHDLCLCKKTAGESVSFEDLRNFINFDWLINSSSIELYSKAQGEIVSHLASVTDRYEHYSKTWKVDDFISCFEGSSCYSINPEIDFNEIYKQNKYLFVILPAIERDPDVFNVYGTTMLLLLEQARAHQKTDGLPTEFIQDVLTYNGETKFFVESPKPALSVHSIYEIEQSKKLGYSAHLHLIRNSRSCLLMKSESACSTVSVSEVEKKLGHKLELRQLYGFFPGEGKLFGRLAWLNHGKFQAMINKSVNIVCRYNPTEMTTEVSLSRKNLLDH